jgi:hypothetical protein
MTIDVNGLIDRRRWTGPAGGTDALIVKISLEEANAIANDLEVQAALETFLFQRYDEQPAIRRLIMLVRDDAEVAAAIEVVLDEPGTCRWDVVHAPTESRPAISFDLDGKPRRLRHAAKSRSDDSN